MEDGTDQRNPSPPLRVKKGCFPLHAERRRGTSRGERRLPIDHFVMFLANDTLDIRLAEVILLPNDSQLRAG